MKPIRIASAACLLVVVYVLAVVFVNRSNRQSHLETIGASADLQPAADTLSVTTWNLGYGGLGAESDFIADGGERLLPPGRNYVDKNVAGITATLKAIDTDIFIFQEVARASFLTLGADPLGAVNSVLAARDNAFSPDLDVRLVPQFFGPQHGLYSSATAAGARREIVMLPLDTGYLMGVATRLFHMHIVRIPSDGGGWTIINIHLAAFDDDARTRLAQARAVLDFAEREFAQGRHVVVGGDWNLEFARPPRPTTTAPEHLFWIYPFPYAFLTGGWRAAIDPATPTVRTNERPYKRGENFTTVIDGFIVSPNVEIVSVAAKDLDFQHSDHQPVTGAFRASAKPYPARQ